MKLLLVMTSKNPSINLIARRLNDEVDQLLTSGTTCILTNLDLLERCPNQRFVVTENPDKTDGFDVEAGMSRKRKEFSFC